MDALDTNTLLGVKVQQDTFEAFFLKMFFPNVVTFADKKISFDKIRKGVRLAPFVAPMESGKPRRAQGGATTSFEPAYVKPTDVVEAGRLIKRLPGEVIAGQLSPAQRRNAIIGDILQDQEQSIVHTEEWLAVQAVVHGQVVIEAEDYPAQLVDYERSASNQIVLSGAAKWDTVDPETYDPTDDMESWAENATGNAEVCIMSDESWRKFRKFKQVREYLKLDVANGEADLMLTPDIRKNVQYKGRFGAFFIYVYKGAYDHPETGVKTRFMPADYIVFGPSGADEVLAYGGIQDAKANAQGIAEATRYPSNFFTENPSVEWLQTQAAPLPVIFDANAYVAVKTQ
ncbi:major capsid protein [Oceanospirillum sp. HFRX-1_2]